MACKERQRPIFDVKDQNKFFLSRSLGVNEPSEKPSNVYTQEHQI